MTAAIVTKIGGYISEEQIQVPPTRKPQSSRSILITSITCEESTYCAPASMEAANALLNGFSLQDELTWSCQSIRLGCDIRQRIVPHV
jgi:hypothetical protein